MLLSQDFQGYTYGGELLQGWERLIEIQQQFDTDAIRDLESAVDDSMARLNTRNLPEGSRVIVTAGSRGIAHIPRVLGRVCLRLREAGMEPMVLGAMGSHGGGTREGQMEVLRSLGIDSVSVGAPVETSSETVAVGRTRRGLTVYCDPMALRADGVIAVNRIKSHTTARGPIESGLVKKLVVGLGHRAGAESFHQCGPAAMSEELEEMAGILLSHLPFLGGLALVENAHKELHTVEWVPPAELFERERALLCLSKDLTPALPFDAADVLVVKLMGKDYSGTGVDTGVIGRYRVQGEPDASSPLISRICVLDLSDASHGNATGIGLVDLVTRRLAGKVDPEATYTNVLTSTLTMRAMLPMVMRTDEDAVGATIASAAVPPSRPLRLAVIDNTLELERLWVSPGLLDQVERRSYVKMAGREIAAEFDEDGDLITP
ncbi:MAG: lactate racemase domain-containing protein [Bacillota bacterium]